MIFLIIFFLFFSQALPSGLAEHVVHSGDIEESVESPRDGGPSQHRFPSDFYESSHEEKWMADRMSEEMNEKLDKRGWWTRLKESVVQAKNALFTDPSKDSKINWEDLK